MVKGKRVEAEEVEGWLKEHGGLKEVVVTVKGEVRGQEEELAVWGVSGAERAVVSAELKEYLQRKGGAELAAERITMLEALPRDEGSGEVDYRALGQMLGGGEVE